MFDCCGIGEVGYQNQAINVDRCHEVMETVLASSDNHQCGAFFG
jgi:hypothetical protein